MGLDDELEEFSKALTDEERKRVIDALELAANLATNADGDVSENPLTDGQRAKLQAVIDDLEGLAGDDSADMATLSKQLGVYAGVLRAILEGKETDEMATNADVTRFESTPILLANEHKSGGYSQRGPAVLLKGQG